MDLSQWRALARHPLSAIFPDMSEAEFEALTADMKQHGYDQKQQVLLFEGKVLDGWHRLRAAVITGKTPTFDNYKGSDPNLEVARRNNNRRHMDAGQRAMVAARLATYRHGGDRKSEGQDANLHLETTQAEAAKEMHVSKRTVADAAKVIDQGTPALQKAVDTKKVSVSDAAAVANEPPEVQDAAVADVEAGKATTARAAVKQRSEPMDSVPEPEAVTCPTCRGKGTVSQKKADTARFVKPSFDEVEAYCRERKNKVDPKKWMDHYISNGWRVGKNAMRDWRACVRNWETSEFGGDRPTAREAGRETKEQVDQRQKETEEYNRKRFGPKS